MIVHQKVAHSRAKTSFAPTCCLRQCPNVVKSDLEGIEERCHTLGQFPMMGVSREELLPSLRSLVVGNYVVFYLPIEYGIDVVRVLHGMRDIDTFF